MLVPGGLDRGDLVGSLHQAERDQHGQQHDQRRDVVEQIGRDVEQVLGDDGRRNLVAQNVSQQLEQSEYENEHQERGEDHPR